MMVRLNVLLLFAVIGSALFLVRTQYESRLLYSALDKEISSARQLTVESERLQVLLRAQAAAARVETFARKNLKMTPASPSTTRYVIDPLHAQSTRTNVPPAVQGGAS